MPAPSSDALGEPFERLDSLAVADVQHVARHEVAHDGHVLLVGLRAVEHADLVDAQGRHPVQRDLRVVLGELCLLHVLDDVPGDVEVVRDRRDAHLGAKGHDGAGQLARDAALRAWEEPELLVAPLPALAAIDPVCAEVDHDRDVRIRDAAHRAAALEVCRHVPAAALRTLEPRPLDPHVDGRLAQAAYRKPGQP